MTTVCVLLKIKKLNADQEIALEMAYANNLS